MEAKTQRTGIAQLGAGASNKPTLQIIVGSYQVPTKLNRLERIKLFFWLWFTIHQAPVLLKKRIMSIYMNQPVKFSSIEFIRTGLFKFTMFENDEDTYFSLDLINGELD
jgi:hypothetical protein